MTLSRRWTPEDDAQLAWLWEQYDTRKVAAKLGRTAMAIYHRVSVLGLGNGVPRGGETVEEAARRCGVSGEAMRLILAMGKVRLRLCRWNPHSRQRDPRVRWVRPEDADRAMRLWCLSETITDAAARLQVSRYALDRILRERGQVMEYGRCLRVVPRHADAAARDWLAAGGQIKGPRSTRYPSLDNRQIVFDGGARRVETERDGGASA